VTVLVLQAYVFVCDAEGCDEDTGKIDPPNVSNPGRSAWRVARSEGWTNPASGGHLCPKHQERESRR
jgi:hypothetical protein